MRERFEREAKALKTSYSGLLWAMEKHMAKHNEAVAERLKALRKDLRLEFGGASGWAARLIGPLMLWSTKREQKRLDKGVTYEPETFILRANWHEA